MEKLFGKENKSYDKYFYSMVDDAEELAAKNRELDRQAKERRVARAALMPLRPELADDSNTPFEGDWRHIGQGTKVVGGTGRYVPRDGSSPSIRVDAGYRLNSPETPEVYRGYHKDAVRLATNKYGHINQISLVRAIYDTVVDRMQVSEENPDNIASMEVMDLSKYMEHGEGGVLPRVLACAALLDAGGYGWDVSVETGTRFNQDDTSEHELRVWVRYKDRAGAVWILDPNTNDGYCGRLEDSGKDASWNYSRDEEREYLRQNRGRKQLSSIDLDVISLEAVRKEKERKKADLD